MGDLTQCLSRSEFACECGCGLDTVDHQLAEWIQDAADYFASLSDREVGIIISGGNRCATHNAHIGGASKSQHIRCRAADHKLFYRDTGEHIDPQLIYDYYNTIHPICGLGLYHNRVHLDTRNATARWVG